MRARVPCTSIPVPLNDSIARGSLGQSGLTSRTEWSNRSTPYKNSLADGLYLSSHTVVMSR